MAANWKIQKQKEYLSVIQVLCGEHEWAYDVLQPTQIRITGKGFMIDIYPNSNKYFDVIRQEWGQFQDIVKFLNQFV